MKKVLIIDDDPDILEAVQMVLTSGGYESEGITKGEETYRKVDEFSPDLIILDVLLSGNDGRTICKKLKTDIATLTIPVIMMSAHPLAKGSVNDCGANAFIAKPFSVDELLQAVQALLNKSHILSS